MTERYLISGVQIGMISALLNSDEKEKAIEVLDSVFNEQFLGNSKTPLAIDIDKLSKHFKSKRY